MPKRTLSDKVKVRYVLFNPCYGCENAIIWLWNTMPKGQRQMLFRALRDFGVAAIASNRSKAHATAASFGQKWTLRPGNPSISVTSNPVRIALTILDTSERVREDVSCGLARLATISPDALTSGLEKIQQQGRGILRAAEILMLAQAVIQKELGTSSEQGAATAPPPREPRSKQSSAPQDSTGASAHSVTAATNTTEATKSGIASKRSPAPQSKSVQEQKPEEEEPEVDWGSLAGFDDMAYEGN